MADIRAITYIGPGRVEVKASDFPKLETPRGEKAGRGVILKIVSTNICGSDLHMVHGRTPSPAGIPTAVEKAARTAGAPGQHRR